MTVNQLYQNSSPLLCALLLRCAVAVKTSAPYQSPDPVNPNDLLVNSIVLTGIDQLDKKDLKDIRAASLEPDLIDIAANTITLIPLEEPELETQPPLAIDSQGVGSVVDTEADSIYNKSRRHSS